MRTEDSVCEDRKRPDRIVSVDVDATIAEAADLMQANRIGCLVVTDAGAGLVGIMTERDILERVVAPGVAPAEVRVRDVMTPSVASCGPGTPMAQVQDIMTQCRIRHLPVVDGEVVVDMISSREVMAHQLARHRTMRAAAEQIAKLSSSLKNLDFNEVVNMITCEVPRVFQAARSVLCVSNGKGGRGAMRISRSKCPCPESQLRGREDARSVCEKKEMCLGNVSRVCARLGGKSPSVIIPLNGEVFTAHESEKGTPARSYLCMCDFDGPQDISIELISYKSDLLRDVLSANLANARLYQEYLKAKRTSLTDPLTGVGTRRFFEEQLEAECGRADRYSRSFCLAIMDVDRFKWLNDELGHADGDQALVDISECMRREKRTSDVLARHGGDEFILLMPETDIKGAATGLERISAAVQRIPVRDGRTLTISCGAVERTASSPIDAAELMRRADLALYQAKNAGRGRIECWDGIPDNLKDDSEVESEQVNGLRDRIADLLAESKEVFLQSIWGLIQALDARDPYTKSHSENVMRYAVGIAETMGIGEKELGVIRRAAMIHDIGKIGVPDSILRCTGKLSDEQRRIVQQHPLTAVRILDQMKFLEREIPIVRHHHERWDGRGYPDGAAGSAIERGARILAVADAFDAITSTRTYHEAKSLPEATHALVQGSGGQFDPEVVAAMNCWVQAVARELGKQGELTPRDLLDSQEACILAL